MRCIAFQGSVNFPDAAGSGHAQFISCLSHFGVVQGMPDGLFRPAEAVTRGQLASFVVRALEVAGHDLEAVQTDFPDVGANSTHGRNIAKLAGAGIIRGFDDGTFRPSQAVSRDQTARYVANAVELVTDEALPTSGALFPDVPQGSLYAGDIDKLVTAEVVSGFPNGIFGPREAVTRGQMTRFIGNMRDLVANGEADAGS